jgi:hypothetical protein
MYVRTYVRTYVCVYVYVRTHVCTHIMYILTHTRTHRLLYVCCSGYRSFVVFILYNNNTMYNCINKNKLLTNRSTTQNQTSNIVM